jgi:hypothetical protein
MMVFSTRGLVPGNEGVCMIKRLFAFGLLAMMGLLPACTQETQNQMSRSIQNWTGVNGVLEIYAGDKLVRKFIQVDKLTTATATTDGASRPYRFGYGVLDENLDGVKNNGEKRVYFEFSDYSTNYIFFEKP